MNESVWKLAPSLVGGSIDFSFKREGNATSIEKNIAVEKDRIKKNVNLAFSVGGSLCVTLLAEMVSFYSKEIYYMAVRSSIEMRRYRPFVLEYLTKSIEERAENLESLFKEKTMRKDSSIRDAKIEALRYFLTTYNSRAKDFKRYLTREEYIVII